MCFMFTGIQIRPCDDDRYLCKQLVLPVYQNYRLMKSNRAV